MRLLPVIVLLLVVLAGCAGTTTTAQDRPPAPHPMLADVDPPPPNRPLARPTAAVQRPAAPALPDDDRPALMVLRDGSPVEDTLQVEGGLELSPRRITVKSAEAEGVEILYRLPEGLAAPAHVPGRATASVRDLSGPQGADRLVTVRDPQGLTFLELWRRSPDPIQVESGDLLIEQRAVQADASNPQGVYVAAPVFISAGEKQQEIPIGRAVRVETGRQALNVYVETSHLFAAPEDVDHGGRYYILRVWITGAKPAGRE